MATANIPNDPVAIQKLFTSRDNYANAESFVGEVQRLWYNPITNCIYVSDGNTPGGIPINFCGSANLSANLEILDEGVTITASTASIDFVGAGVTATATGSAVTVSVPVQSYIANGTSWANIATANGNLTININNNEWIFDTSGNLAAPGNISAVGNIQGDWLIASGGNTIIDSGVSTTGNVTGGNIITLGNIQGGNLSVTGNATAGNISTAGNVTGNYGIFSGGNTVINSTISTTGNILAGNVSVSGNVIAGNIIGNTAFNGGYYGSFYDEFNQYALDKTTGKYPANLHSTVNAYGFQINNDGNGYPTIVKVANTGFYNVQFSAEFHNTGGGGSGTDVEIWLQVNGNALSATNTRVTVNTNSPFVVPAWNWMLPLNANDELQMMWATENINIIMEASSSFGGNPSIPSLILTVSQIA